MTLPHISTEDTTYRKYVTILDTPMAYVDVGNGDHSLSPDLYRQVFGLYLECPTGRVLLR